ncbi:mechanosensitive ion channel protein 10-like isoform X1 [Ananas comosus]|uniref:Mechanosensitive ion channel protein n=1 Tax=Ananas comosus TaxID=4615 RepID=A0A6P5GXD5_ANACO|nr:mechanosensitive ion channel protein 10-like isoform X1 [Ananas comosus]
MDDDAHKERSIDRKQGEVVVVIQTGAAAAAAAAKSAPTSSANVEGFEDSAPKSSPPRVGNPSPEIAKAPSPRKLPRTPNPETLIRCRSISKPKSRFVEHPPHSSAAAAAPTPSSTSPNPRASLGTPKTPLLDADDEEEEDEEIYKKEQHINAKANRRRRWRLGALVEWAILILAMGCLIASLTVRKLQGSVIWGLEIWKWCLMVTVIGCGGLVTQWLIDLLVFMIERNFLLKKKVLYFVYGLKDSVRACIWLGLVLLSWSLLFNQGLERSKKMTKILNYVSRFLASLLIGSVIWLAKTLGMKILASSFHMTKFFDRIQESIFHQYLLQALSGPPLMEMAEKVGREKSTGQLSFRSTGKGKAKGGEEQAVIDVGKLHKMDQEKVSAWTMRGLINVIRTSELTTISNTIENFDEEGWKQKDREINSEWEAKAAAYRIFKNVAKPDHKYIDEEDLMRFLSKEEVESVLPMFEGAAETRKIKKSALKNWVVKAYLDRKSLAHSLNDTKTAVRQLHKLTTIIVVIVIIIVMLLMMGIATTQVIVVISSQLLVVVFMFGNTCKTTFEAIIFVFIMHPFDVGDRCVVDGVQMTVEEMNILTTVFLRYDNEKIYYPNAVLSTKPISNFYRSPNMSDSVGFAVDISTSVESIATLKSKIKAYIESKPTHWQPNHSIVVKDIVNVNKMNMALYVQHTINFQNISEKNGRRSDLVLELKKIFEELSIQCHLPPHQVQLSHVGSNPLPLAISQAI